MTVNKDSCATFHGGIEMGLKPRAWFPGLGGISLVLAAKSYDTVIEGIQ